MAKRNYHNAINGQKPEFGNVDHIKWLKQKNAQIVGAKAICEIEWEFVRISNRTTETRKPITYACSPFTADGVQAFIPCPKCGRLHKHVVGYDPYEIDQTAEFAQIEAQEIICWNCGLEMYIDEDGSRNVYVKQPICN